MIKLFTLSTQCFTILAAILVFLANDWLTTGHGLNPWLAIPAATVCMIIPFVIDNFFIEVFPTHDELPSYIERCTNDPVEIPNDQYPPDHWKQPY